MRFLFVRPEVCPWVSRFPTSGFLQIPPRSGHPCLRLYPSHYRADLGLAPLRNVRRQAHYRKNPETLPFPGFSVFHSMRMVGLEPTRGHPRKILSLVRLPFRHIRLIGFLWKPNLIISLVQSHCNIFLFYQRQFPLHPRISFSLR